MTIVLQVCFAAYGTMLLWADHISLLKFDGLTIGHDQHGPNNNDLRATDCGQQPGRHSPACLQQSAADHIGQYDANTGRYPLAELRHPSVSLASSRVRAATPREHRHIGGIGCLSGMLRCRLHRAVSIRRPGLEHHRHHRAKSGHHRRAQSPCSGCLDSHPHGARSVTVMPRLRSSILIAVVTMISDSASLWRLKPCWQLVSISTDGLAARRCRRPQNWTGWHTHDCSDLRTSVLALTHRSRRGRRLRQSELAANLGQLMEQSRDRTTESGKAGDLQQLEIVANGIDCAGRSWKGPDRRGDLLTDTRSCDVANPHAGGSTDLARLRCPAGRLTAHFRTLCFAGTTSFDDYCTKTVDQNSPNRRRGHPSWWADFNHVVITI